MSTYILPNIKYLHKRKIDILTYETYIIRNPIIQTKYKLLNLLKCVRIQMNWNLKKKIHLMNQLNYIIKK